MKTGFIGSGNMAGAIIRGIVKNGINPADIYTYDLDKEKVAQLAGECGIKAADSNEQIGEECEVIVLAVKPHLIKGVLEGMRHTLNSEKQVLVSIAAGTSIEMLENFAGVEKMPVIRVMPNINVTVLQGISSVCANKYVKAEQLEFVKNMFEKVGKVVELEENFFGIFGALAGSSPAFAYLFIESLAMAAHKAGMPKAKAVEIAAQAVLGSSAMVLESGKHPWELIDSVCSPGGTTIEGIFTLENNGFQAAVVKCIDACMAKDAAIMNKNK
ncbi:pyrroline-5-carboxylate reductase [Tyzzerella sp. OttesenSCG-928-J15]|nr:pyrroline-5-carboxylate reductase [Tyzzerella sp. OttesenSCG-928-J15]